MDASKYQLVEWRVSIYGKSMDEWSKLAKWFYTNRLAHSNVRWLIQVPRLYQIYRSANEVKNFAEMMNNVFYPLFQATLVRMFYEYYGIVRVVCSIQWLISFDGNT